LPHGGARSAPEKAADAFFARWCTHLAESPNPPSPRLLAGAGLDRGLALRNAKNTSYFKRLWRRLILHYLDMGDRPCSLVANLENSDVAAGRLFHFGRSKCPGIGGLVKARQLLD
jgi:hypothetical protein